MHLPDWLLPTFILLPALLWLFLGIGIPWALAVLPRTDWRKPATVIAVAIALGPLALTTAMFFIGTFGQFTISNVLIASVLVAVIGAALAWRFRGKPISKSGPNNTLQFGVVDGVLIFVIVIAVIARFWNTAYWPYTTYDEFWAYGYNAKIFMLQGKIPTNMGYYPQLLPLAYTFMQLLWGGINDHAARTVVPMFAVGSILMAYLLGARLFNRRVGLLAAAIWTLYPHQAAWSQFGDLEMPVTFFFTGTALFFILGWREQNRRYIILSGLLLAAALWTKPTAGALVESLLLIMIVCAITLWRRMPDLKALIKAPLVREGMLALLVAAPIGGMWYIRNVLLGHVMIVFPAGYWQNEAQRSGQEFGWPLLIAAVGVIVLIVQRQRIGAAIGGMALFALGTIPSAFGYRLPTTDEWRQMLVGAIPIAIHPSRLSIVEVALIIIGIALLVWAAFPLWRRLTGEQRGVILLIGAFILPYFATWFWSYSYHYRLSFPIVPLLVVLVAVLVDQLLEKRIHNPVYAFALSVMIISLAFPAWWATLDGLEPALNGSLPNDHDKIAQGNQALMGLVDFLAARRAELNRPIKVEAPGELRLAFFFPTDDIRAGDYPIHNGNYPVWLDDIANADYFVDSSVGQRLYNENHKLDHNQILSSLTRENVLKRVYTIDDGNFRFWVYAVDNKGRFAAPQPDHPLNAQIGDFAHLVGYNITGSNGAPGSTVTLTLWWQALKTPTTDYSVFIHLWDANQQKLLAAWGGEPLSDTHSGFPYHTRLWETGEYIEDSWQLTIPADAPPSKYELHIGLFDPIAGPRLPVQQDGTTIGDSLTLSDFTVLPK